MRTLRLLVSTLLLSVLSSNARAQAPPSEVTPKPVGSGAAAGSPAASESKRDEARSHFELGLSHFDREEWSAALAEFLSSRALFPTRNATKNAAICLRKGGRFEEALDLWDALEREFGGSLSPTDRALADKEMAELRASVGAIDVRGAEPGATIVIDGRERGTFPLATPLRVGAGSHVVRVYKEGFRPYEGRADVAGKQTAIIDAKLGALTESGRLRVAEQTGRVLDVVIDGAVVGKTPWEGTLAAVSHDVVLRGEGDLGTQPAEAPVRLNQLTSLTLVAEQLEASVRVDPTPTGASVAVDGVVVGRGVWEGKLRTGGHRVEVAADGFLPFARNVSVSKGQREAVPAVLERDPSSPMWAARHPSRFFAEVDGAVLIAPSLGGDLTSACSGACSSGLALGGSGVFHGGYQLGSGLGLAIDAGYLSIAQSLHSRATTLSPVGGLTANKGKADDSLVLAGLALGASASYHRGETWPVLLRLGVGVLLGSAKDARSGTFTNSRGDEYRASSTESPSATYITFAPEVRIGRRFGSHFEVNVGVTALVMTGLGQAKWQDKNPVSTSPHPLTDSGDGLATFGSQAVVGSTIVAILPGLGARYEL